MAISRQVFARFASIAALGITLFNAPQLRAQTELTGYVQAEWQRFDLDEDPDGRAIYKDSRDNFFTIRRGRLKVAHTQDRFNGAIQFDATERGMEIKDAYLGVKLLQKDLLNVTVGLFNRPNYEVELSSRKRESPERSQIIRAFYPSERDLGFMFESKPTIGENVRPRIQLGLFNGTMQETDPYKDIIGRISLPLPFGSDTTVSLAVGGSFYYGGIPAIDDSLVIYENGAKGLEFIDTSSSFAGWGNRRHVGVEAQFGVKLFGFGKTELRGEYLTGQRPASTIRTALVEVQEGDSTFIESREVPTLALRNQSGYYLMLVQSLGKKVKVAAKYDYYDRNTDLSGTDVSSSGDRASTILGFGVLGDFGPIRLTAWYEIPSYATDEARYTDGSGAVQSDDIDDNKTTIRFQYTIH